MKIRKKIFVRLGFTLLALGVLIAVIITVLTIDGLRKLEDQKLLDNKGRIEGYLENERDRLKFLTVDWGSWDESFDFVNELNTDQYTERNLSTNALVNFDANLVVYATPEGRVAWGTLFDMETQIAGRIPDEWVSRVVKPPLLVRTDHTSGPVTVSMLIDDKPYLLGSGPILRSDYSGPAAGSIIFGRELDQGFIRLMQDRLKLDVDILTPDQFNRQGLHVRLETSRSRAPLSGRIISRDTVNAYFSVSGPDNQPAYIVEYSFVRDIYRQGVRQLILMLLSISVGVLVIGTVFWRLLERDVLSRLTSIDDQIGAIRSSGDLNTIINLDGDDELGELAREMNRMLAAIREQRKVSDIYLQVARVIIGALDAEGRVITINPRGCELLGFRREEIIGMDWFANFIPVRLRSELTGLYSKIMQGQIELSRFYENAVVTRNGKELVLSFHNELIRHPTGRIDGVIFSAEDITDRRRREEERSRLEKLESLGLMAGGIAHDFNNTLTAIMANIDLLKPGANVPDTEKPEIIKDALDGAQRARDLTMQLLTFAKGGDPVREIIHIGDLIRNSVRFALRGSVSRHHIDMDDKLWAVSVDITQITQVILNIIINADHAMPTGGVVHVVASNHEVHTNSSLPLKPGPFVLIEVSDEGHGIPREDIGRIFDPYFTTKQAGSGLGLSTAFSIVRRHGGHITVQSIVGQGTTFRIYLPALPGATVGEPERKVEKAMVLEGMKILVVDDDEVLLRVIQRILHSNGCTVEVADSSVSAVEAMRQARQSGKPFSLAIMDLVMPGDLGGLKILAKLREIDPELKAIVASGYSNDPVLSDPQRYGFARAVAKPFESASLIKAIMDVIRTSAPPNQLA